MAERDFFKNVIHGQTESFHGFKPCRHPNSIFIVMFRGRNARSQLSNRGRNLLMRRQTQFSSRVGFLTEIVVMSDNLVQNLVKQNNRQLKKEFEVGSGVNRGWIPEIFVQPVRIEHTLLFNVPSSSNKGTTTNMWGSHNFLHKVHIHWDEDYHPNHHCCQSPGQTRSSLRQRFCCHHRRPSSSYNWLLKYRNLKNRAKHI
jgi:hypothetical protein